MQIELRHIHKHFGAVHANNDITLTFGSGRVIGVLGENGAGKSTLMKILSGYQQADANGGDILIDGVRVDLNSPQAALRHGIGMLQQDPLDVGAFTVLENFIYGASGRFFIGKRQARNQLMALCARFGFDIPLEKPISALSIAARQQLEILRQLSLGVKTLILDEPTTGISEDQKTLLFNTLRNLTREDGMTILLVSHKLEDVIALCDEVVILRGGKVVGELQMPASKAELVQLMFGGEMKTPVRVQRDVRNAPVVLELNDISLQAGRLTVAQLSLQVRAGEVIGLAGLDGSGQELMMRVCAGLIRPVSGRVRVNDLDLTGQPYYRYMGSGVAFGAAGRLEEGLIAGLTITEHMALIHKNGLLLDYNVAERNAHEHITLYNIRGLPNSRIETLSGGNQQRVLMGLLPPDAKLLVLEQPTRGLDVDSAAWIWQQLEVRRAKGAAIVFSSADLDEILAYSDRIIVFYAGRPYVIDDPSSVTVSDLGHYIGGEYQVAQ